MRFQVLPLTCQLLFCALGWNPVHAQTNIRGRVLEAANLEPVPGALVAIEGSQLSSRTDANGEFRLSGPSVIRPFASGSARATYSVDGATPVRLFSKQGEPLGIESVDAKGSRRIFPMSSFPENGFTGFDSGSSPDAMRLAKRGSVAARLSVTVPLLVGKTIDLSRDTGDIGAIILSYPTRRVDTGSPPIYGALRLFDGNGDSTAAKKQLDSNWIMWESQWRKSKNLGSTPVLWKILPDPESPSNPMRNTISPCCFSRDGSPGWGYDDLVTKRRFNDFQLHVEFNLMGAPGDSDPTGYANSGVYLSNRYEIQVETPASPWDPGNTHGIGAIINEYAPPMNFSRPPGKWQAYDITFRNDRWLNGKRVDSARVTIFWNGALMHTNRKISGTIACCDAGNAPMDSTSQGLKFQNENGLDVRYRNVWLKPLNIKDTLTNFGY